MQNNDDKRLNETISLNRKKEKRDQEVLRYEKNKREEKRLKKIKK